MLGVQRCLLVSALIIPCGCDRGGGGTALPDRGSRAGGDTTVDDATSQAFGRPAPNLDAAELERHLDGDAAFEAAFVSSGQPVNPGLGPVFNNTSCARCHPSDGRGRPPEQGGAMTSMLVRISVGNDPVTGPVAVPGMGRQLQHRALFGVPPEAGVEVRYTEIAGKFADGMPYSLRDPVYSLNRPADPDALATNGIALERIQISPRVAPPIFGRGLLEAIPEEDILAAADPDDRDGDGISGRANYVRDDAAGATRLGRFGLKANNPTLQQQNAGAYQQDMGISNPYYPADVASGQVQFDGVADDPELGIDPSTARPNPGTGQEILDAVTFYTQTLAVPARRNIRDPRVARGEVLFLRAKCAACHTPTFVTGDSPVRALANQRIYPYSDMLLHDMGAALADGRPDFLATGTEWRTAPLWGIGLTTLVNGHAFYLHDGRARDLTEAILWHGGEAKTAMETFRRMPREDRDALLEFLKSL